MPCYRNTTGHPEGWPVSKNVRRRPTLPRSLPRSTIGAEGLSFRVRNGAGRFPFAMAAETLWRYVIQAAAFRPRYISKQARKRTTGPDRISGTAQWTRASFCSTARVEKRCGQVLGLLVPVSSMRCRTSTSGLSTQSSSWGPYPVNPVGDLILERASRLDAFSGYPFRT
jgi:hypothetical protein